MKWEPGPEIDDQKGNFKYMKLVSTLEKRLITSAVNSLFRVEQTLLSVHLLACNFTKSNTLP